MITDFLNALRNMRLKRKLILTYFIVVLIPIALLGSYAYFQSVNQEQLQINHRMNDVLHAYIERFHLKLERYDQLISNIIYDTILHGMVNQQHDDPLHYKQFMLSHMESSIAMTRHLNPEIADITIYTTKEIPKFSEYLQHLNDWRDQAKLSGRNIDHLTGLDNRRNHWIFTEKEIVVTRAFPEVLFKSVPTYLVLRLNKARFYEQTISGLSAPYGIMVSDEATNTIVYSSLPISSEKITKEYYYIAKGNIASTELQMIFFTAKDAYSPETRSIAFATIALLAVCTVTLFLLIWFFSNTMLKPIRKLNQRMKMVEEGNFTLEVIATSKDELGELTNRFGMMLQKINKLIKEVYESKIIQQQTEFRALQSQIKPHFLYNILSTIKWKALQAGQNDLSQMVLFVSTFYRTSLNNGRNIITIKNELENVKAYLEIQRVLHDNSFEAEFHIDSTILSFDTIHLILQPIVENSIEHGIDQRTDEGGRITITGLMDEGGNIRFTIEDNGPGMIEQIKHTIFAKKNDGYGLKNVHERIRLFFGEPYGVHIIKSSESGTTIELLLPPYQHEE